MFYGYCLLIFVFDAIAAMICKSSILVLPSLLVFFTLLVSLFVFEYREKIKTARVLNLAACVILLIYGLLGQTYVTVPIRDYMIISAQALCGMLTICTDIFISKNQKQ